MVAEQFGTLEALYPGRIDLGVGRAPGSDGPTARALRRTMHSDPEAFPQDVQELSRLGSMPGVELRVREDVMKRIRALPSSAFTVVTARSWR